ncbi:DUF5336 domain-containing protein [Mycobacterium sp.]|uniref:DUF5336 domain-containing protein n=1 Tax=Mycobacterium sp. TaxID=1785 RepID=UPI003D6AB12D
MTYSPGSSGYPSAQSPGSYGASTPSFAKSNDNAGKPQPYLIGAVIVLGLVAYFVSFGVTTTTALSSGDELTHKGGGFPVAAALLAALLAATGLLPKAKNYVPVVTAISALGALLAIESTIHASGGGWEVWLVLACVVLQAFAAAGAQLLDAGVITPPAPRPKYNQYNQYGQYGSQPGGYYGQQQAPYQQHGPQQSGYGSQYGGYSSSPTVGLSSGPSTGGFGTIGSQSGPQQSQSGPQQGAATPPTGFPSFGPPPSSAGSDSATQVFNRGDSGNHGGQERDQQGHGQGQQSSSAGPGQP